MDRLPSVIGPAPSEVPLEDFVKRLRGERQRVVQALHDFQLGYKKKPKKRKKAARKKIDPELEALMKELGMNYEDVKQFIKDQKK